MDFIEEKVGEAMHDESVRGAAISEAAGAIPVLRDRLRENDVMNANFILVLGNMVEARYAEDWWDDFGGLDRHEFEDAAQDLVGPEGGLAILRKVVV
ncbi:hypothetical protein JQ617_29255 [Bradyrhizobium sp. KB893862 SZCCT0404]|uniref:hypothetical protein n=1 Tax=Bradyrhizobium sp. KB893862 SZCCT0404 TaxID=2807672 RepID=UPI001BA6C2A8|nr:hypothetical protein [Bradyrhizobium sp. KB893862 SZCCT0404]MBR1178080.1 hypothetical protein [Bradyrhizobium sp. KB893862 SZCCT0404]